MHAKIIELFGKYPHVLHGFSDIGFSSYSAQYKCALVFAVPHAKFLTVGSYKEVDFEALIVEAQKTINKIHSDLRLLFIKKSVKYEFPPVAQSSEETLLAPFSFKFAAVNAGLGWIGKNGVLISERYGPRIRLSAVLIDYTLPLGSPIVSSRCPDDCFKCIIACPYQALTGNQWNINSDRSDIIDYFLCNRMRSLYIKSHNRKHSCGICMVSCPLGL